MAVTKRDLLDKIDRLQVILVDYATGGAVDPEVYRSLREELLQEPDVSPLLPRFVRNCRDLPQFWAFIKGKFAHYQERRQYIWSEFAPLVEKLELEVKAATPVDPIVAGALGDLDTAHVQRAWTRALERRVNDPEGAITAARTLLESTCKSLLDEMGVEYSDNADLPQLYRLVAEQLTLAPSQHTEKVFKQILGGCQAVVKGLGSLRNKLGDAHGQGKQLIRPAQHHAELAVNLAGAMAMFLVRTWRYRQDIEGGPPASR